MAPSGNSSNLPAPYGGVKQSVPKAALKSPNCENLFNFNTTVEGISLRHGDSKYKSLTQGSGGNIPISLVKYGDLNLLLLTYRTNNNNIEVFDVDSASVIYSSVLTGTSSFFTPLYFMNYLFMLEPFAYKPGFFFDGSTCGAMASVPGGGWTDSARTFAPVGGNVYNHRAYLIRNNFPGYWYTEIDSISGDLKDNFKDLSGLISEQATLILIATTTISAASVTAYGTERPIFQSFVFSSGEILFFKGTYPDSDDWTYVARSQIGQPLSYRSALAYQGDTLIFCDTGVVSLRDLFLQGSEDAQSLTVNANMQASWQALVQAVRTQFNLPVGLISFHITGIFDLSTNRIIISMPFYLDSSGVAQFGSYYFVFDTIQQAWFFHRSYGIGANVIPFDLSRYKNKDVFAAVGTTKIMIYTKEGATGFTDRNPEDSAEVAYDYDFISAPIPFTKTEVNEVTGLEPIIQSDLYAQTFFRWISDFGKQISGNQTVDALTTSVAKPLANVGMQNITYVQLEVFGTTTTGKTVGLDLYSYNVWYSQGEKGSR